MKTVILESILLAIFSCCIYPGSGITALDNATYEIFVQMIKGEFSIPVTEPTAKINSARVRFWRNKDNLSLRGGVLCFKGKAIAKKSALEKVVKKSFKTSKGSGTRKMYDRLKDSYSGISERNVPKVLSKSTIHQKLNVRFQNRPRLRPIRARDVQVRHQIDLVDMNKLRTKYKGKVFRYLTKQELCLTVQPNTVVHH